MNHRELIGALTPALANAERLVALALEPGGAGQRAAGDLGVDTRAIWEASTVQDRYASMERMLKCWLDRDAPPAHEFESNVAASVALWLGLYFNGTPKPNIWQTVADQCDREGGSPMIALTMKQYGDVYRIERRRWIERHQRGALGADGTPYDADLAGIVAVLVDPILLLPDEELKIASVDASAAAAIGADNQPAAGRWLNASRLPHLLSDAPDARIDDLLQCVTERLARLYCALQMFAYVRKGLPLRALWRSPSASATQAARVPLTAPLQFVVTASEPLSPDVADLPACVLSTSEGVARDWGQSLSSPSGRAVFSLRLRKLRVRIESVIEGCRAASPSTHTPT